MTTCLRRRSRAVCFWTVAAATLVAGGCGRAECEARVDAAAARLQRLSKFYDLDPADRETPIASLEKQPGVGTRIKFRKPAYFDGRAMTEPAPDQPAATDAPSADRLKPPFLQDFPGFRFSYERVDRDVRGIESVYFYVGAQPADATLTERLLASLKQAFPQANPTWSNVSLDTPEGTKIAWKKLTLEGEQNFLIPGNNSPMPLGGVFTVLVAEQHGCQTVLAWRSTKNAAAKIATKADASAGTLVVETNVKLK